jgi:DNA-directed RNA polymerase specialized sigma24 family protein
MWSRREPTQPLAFLLNSVDRFGRIIEPCVLTVAQEIAPQAVSYGEKLLGDPAFALTLFEEAAASVSRTVRRKAESGQSDIREMRRYLFRVYLRRLGDHKGTEPCRVCAMREVERREEHYTEARNMERRVLVRELLDSCDQVTKTILHRRLEGLSWKEVGAGCGLPANAANLRFSKALRNFQKGILGARAFSSRRTSNRAIGKKEAKEDSQEVSHPENSAPVCEEEPRERFPQS